MRTLGLLAIVIPLFGCSAQARPRFPVVVRVESDPGVPLEGAQLRRDGKTLMRSDASGTMPVNLDGSPGDSIALEVACPDGYRTPTEPLKVLLRPLVDTRKRPEFQVSCRPTMRRLVVAVRASHGPDLPLRYLGQEIARTDSAGAAHALLTAAPGETLTLTLDTSAEPNVNLMPQHPELKISVPDRDDLIVFDQAFTRPVVKIKVRPKPKVGPQRI